MANNYPLDSQVEPDYVTGADCVSVASCRADVSSRKCIIALMVPLVYVGVTVVAELTHSQT